MNPEELRSFCLSLENTTEDFPFGPENLVFRIRGKIYLIIDLQQATHCNVKCDPENAIQYRDEYPQDVLPGYHMNKKHWNTTLSVQLPPQPLRINSIGPIHPIRPIFPFTLSAFRFPLFAFRFPLFLISYLLSPHNPHLPSTLVN